MLISSFKEECKNLLKNKMSLVVLFVLPILTMILIGIEFDKEVISDIPMAVIDKDNSAFSRLLIESFDQNETFKVTNYPDTEQDLESLLKNSEVRTGMIIPKNFFSDVSSLKSPSVIMLYDGSHMAMTSASKSKAMEILLTYKAGATIKQLTGRLNISYEEAFNITQAVQFNSRMLYNPSKSYEDFLAPILMAGFIQIAIVLTATIAFNHDVYQMKRIDRLGYPTGKILLYTLCGSLSFMMCIYMQIIIFKIPFEGKVLDAFILSIGLSWSVSAFCILISALMKNRMIALIAGAVVFIPNSIMAGTTWPIISMPVGYQGFAKYMPFAHYANHIRDIYLKGTSLLQLRSDIIYLFAFGVVTMVLTEIVMIVVDNKELNDHDLPRDLEKRISINI